MHWYLQPRNGSGRHNTQDELTEHIGGQDGIGQVIGADEGHVGQVPDCGCIASALADIPATASKAMVVANPRVNMT